MQFLMAPKLRHVHRAASCFAPLIALLACSRAQAPTPEKDWFTCQSPAPRASDSFSSAMNAAMAHMDRAMNAKGTGDTDHDFATMMIPHHQGAVEMALAELRFGRNEQLRRLAAGIIVEQRAEIATLSQNLENMQKNRSIGTTNAPKTEFASALGEVQ